MPDFTDIVNDRFSIAGVNADGVPYRIECGVYAVFHEDIESSWSFPVGDDEYPPEKWYAATVHDMTGALNNGYKHTGIDLNLAMFEYGDVERRLGLSVYSISDGIVTYVTENWSGVPMIVIEYEHGGLPLWVRYAHIIPRVRRGDRVVSGQELGLFANWKGNGGGDHLHVDCALSEFTREWLTPTVKWIDIADVLKSHLDHGVVQAMVKKG